MTLVESFEHAGMNVRILYDDSGCGDPRECENLAHLYCWHPDYQLGDEQFANAEGRGAGPRKNGYPVPLESHESIEAAYAHCRAKGATVILPLFLYEHSGITISAGAVIDKLSPAQVSTRGRNPFDGAGWDTSWVGFAYATEARRKQLGVKRSRAEIEKQIRAEIEEYDRFLRGEVYGYEITNEYGQHMDSCWGFLGFSYVQEQAREAAEWAAKDERAKELNRLPVPA